MIQLILNRQVFILKECKVEATVTDCSVLACAVAGKGSKFSNVYMKRTIQILLQI